jgi:protein-S-isoprenylcysteine O-methyltransferase Ste14
MKLANILVLIFWIVFMLVWAISAIGIKKDVKQSRSWWNFFWFRAVIVVALVWFLHAQNFTQFELGYERWAAANFAVAVIGVILVGAGVAFAIWARWNLGRNWSGVPRIKEGHELVTSGPYRFVRHPIYTGMTAALLGSALVGGPDWFIAFILFLTVFIFRIPKEEGFMMQLFPDQYPAYRARTKALIPFVW